MLVRDGRFDVAMLAGPGVELWPSAGVRALSPCARRWASTSASSAARRSTCAAWFPLPGTGGIVIVEDVQNRMHRIHARAIVKVSARIRGFRIHSRAGTRRGFMPVATAEKLWRRGRMSWGPATVILGTGNRALRFGSALARNRLGRREVYCVETLSAMGRQALRGLGSGAAAL